jgi:hypothetical protein
MGKSATSSLTIPCALAASLVMAVMPLRAQQQEEHAIAPAEDKVSGIEQLPPFIARARSTTVPFFYTRSLTDMGIQWFSNFETYVSGDVLPKNQVEAFQKAGTKLVMYEWATGFYLDNAPTQNPDERWEADIWHRHPEWLLNRDNPGPDHQSHDILHAYYYDMGYPDLRAYRAKRIVAKLRESGYSGVFYDCTGFQSVWETPTHPLRTLFQQRHPGMNYNEVCVDFYRQVMDSGAFNFLNQCSRFAEYAYPNSAYDLTESLMTRSEVGAEAEVLVEGKGIVKRRETAYVSIDHILSVCSGINQNRKQYNPALQAIHLNYGYSFLEPTGKIEESMHLPIFRETVDRQAIYYGQVCAKLAGQEQYFWCFAPEGEDPVRFHQDPIYFVDLGKPMSDSHEMMGEAYVRFFENGFVVANQTAQPMHLSVTGRLPEDLYGVWDAFSGRVITRPEDGIEIPNGYYPATGTKTPSGRIFAYVRNAQGVDADSSQAHLAFSRKIVEAMAKDGIIDASQASSLDREYATLADSLARLAAGGEAADLDTLGSVASSLQAMVSRVAVVPVKHSWQREALRALGRTCIALDAAFVERRGGIGLADASISFEGGKANQAMATLCGISASGGKLKGAFLLAVDGVAVSEDVAMDLVGGGHPEPICATFTSQPSSSEEHLLFAFARVENADGTSVPLMAYCQTKYSPPYEISIDRSYIPASAGEFEFRITLVNNTKMPAAGSVTLSLPDGLSAGQEGVHEVQVDAASTSVVPVKGVVSPDHPHGSCPVDVSVAFGDAALRQNVEVMVVPRLIARLAAGDVRIDGMLDEAAWQSAHQTTSPFLSHLDGTPVFPQTKVKILYDEAHVYFAFECDEPDIQNLRARITQDDGNVWEDDCAEIYVDTSNRRFGSYHAVFNTLGISFQDNMPGNIGARPNVGIHKAPGRWTAEIAIPYQALGYMGMPKPGDIWGLNLCREKHQPEEICSAWSCGVGGFGDPKKLGELEFSPPLDRQGWKISSSRGDTGYALAHAIDEKPDTFWTNGAKQEMGEWITVDLGEARSFSGLAMDAGIHQDDVPSSFAVYASADGSEWNKISSFESKGAAVNVQMPEQNARYVKIEIVKPNDFTHGWWWTIHDLKFY